MTTERFPHRPKHRKLYEEAEAALGEVRDPDGLCIMIDLLLSEVPDAGIDDLLEMVRDHEAGCA